MDINNLSVTGIYDLNPLSSDPNTPLSRFKDDDQMVVARITDQEGELYKTYRFGVDSINGHIENHVYNRMETNYLCSNTVDIYWYLRCHHEATFDALSANTIRANTICADKGEFNSLCANTGDFKQITLCGNQLSDYIQKVIAEDPDIMHLSDLTKLSNDIVQRLEAYIDSKFANYNILITED